MKYRVPQNVPTGFTWTKSCTVTQTRQGTQLTSLTRTQATSGSESPTTPITAMDFARFGTIYQVNDILGGSCKVKRIAPTGNAIPDAYEVLISETFSSAQDKVIEKTAA